MIEKRQAHYGFSHMPFDRDLAPACCTATHRSFAQAAPSPSGSLNAVSLQRWHARLGQGDDVLPYVNRVTKYDGTFILREVYARALTWTPFALATAGPANLLEAVGALAHITSMEVTLILTKAKNDRSGPPEQSLTA